MSETTALMEQYRTLKSRYSDALLLFQVGDFYETFEQDAHILSSILGLSLTRRNNGRAEDVPMAGFPVRALDSYLPKLIEAGYRVAICDQVEDPKKAKKLVRREVTQIATPGVYWSHTEEPLAALYLSLFWSYMPTRVVIFFADITSSGRVHYYEGPLTGIEGIITAFAPTEVLVYAGQESLWQTLYTPTPRVESLPEWYFDEGLLSEAFRAVYGHELPTSALEAMNGPTRQAFAALLSYLRELHQVGLPHLSFPRALPIGEAFFLDRDTLRNLEVIEPLHKEGKSLLQVLQHTVTSAGTRLLRIRLTMPLRDVRAIEKRLEKVQLLYDEPERHALWQESLRKIGDLERRVARLSARRTTPRELINLRSALKESLHLRQMLPASYESPLPLSQIQEAITLIESYLWLDADPSYLPEKIGEGKIIRGGIDESLDRARYLLHHAQDELLRLEEKEKSRLSIPTLKIQENRQLGYVFYITASYLSRVPPEYRLRQQLAQGHARYSSDELDKLNAEIASAQEVVAEREAAIYHQLINELQAYIPALQSVAHWVAEVDACLALAIAAYQYKYCRPRFTQEPRILIKKGRHPVIERFLPPHFPYQPNDLILTPETRLLLLTGPNMAGKSAYMRQNALILLLAQIGSFVPAEEAEIHPVDQIFSRIGASDNLAGGQSTFLVEMQEMSHILHQATERSFVIIDEVGRGTSTYDGLAIAWAIIEYLHNHPYCRPWTLFATHYHELTQLEKALPRLANYHLAVEQHGERLIFLHQLRRGPIRRSFGVAVAEKAGLPAALISRAKELLKHFEKQASLPPNEEEPSLFTLVPDTEGELRRRLLEIDPNSITPIEALFKLHELRIIATKK